MRHLALTLALGALLLALTAPAASAQNLVTNAGFDTNVDSWTTQGPFPGGSLVWSPLDWAGNPSSGSGFETNDLAAAGLTTYRFSTCMVVPMGTYEFGGHIRFPSGQGTTGRAYVGLLISGFSFCTGAGGLITPAANVTTATPDVWVPLLTQFALNQNNQNAVQVVLVVTKDQAGGTLAAHFDFVRFGLQGTTPVQLLQYTVE